MTIKEDLERKTEALKAIINLHVDLFKQETGYFPNITVSPIEIPGHGDQSTKFIGVSVEVNINL